MASGFSGSVGDRRGRAAKIKRVEQERKLTINAWLDGGYGDPIALACGATPKGIPSTARQIADVLAELRAIAHANQQQAESAEELTTKLARIHRQRHQARRALADWRRVEWNIARADGQV